MSFKEEINKALENVSPMQYDTRIAICNTCPSLSSIKTCSDCKCFMPVKAKLKSQSCPKGKWK